MGNEESGITTYCYTGHCVSNRGWRITGDDSIAMITRSLHAESYTVGSRYEMIALRDALTEFIKVAGGE